MRFLTAYFSAKEGIEITLTGSQRMQERPISILVDALKSLGADIEYLKKEGFPPLKIKGKSLQNKEVKIKANVSSQYISALMLVAPMFPEGLKISLEGKTTSVPYIEMTLSLLKNIGIKGSFNNNEITIFSKKNIESTTLIVESDWSSASYFYSLVALSETCEITLGSFSEKSLQGDAALVQIYDSLGVQTFFNTSEKTIFLSKKDTELPDSLLLDLSSTPDLAQTIAVTCFGLGIGCKLNGLHTLKIKETDRLLALKNEMEKLGATIQVNEDSLNLESTSQILSNKSIETYQDHRMAMAFAPLSLKTNLIINNAEVVSKSYPAFWEDLQKAGVKCEFTDSLK
jgi:3-phosphoshikimate 1-carboxyvinyltransferase